MEVKSLADKILEIATKFTKLVVQILLEKKKTVETQFWIKTQTKILGTDQFALDMWSVLLLFYIMDMFYIMLEHFTRLLLYNSNHTWR